MAAMAEAAVAADRLCLAAPAAPRQVPQARLIVAPAIAMRRRTARRTARRVQQTAPTSAAHYRRTATTAPRPIRAPAALRTSTRCSAWRGRAEASVRPEFLVLELSLDSGGPVDSAASLNVTWAPRARE